MTMPFDDEPIWGTVAVCRHNWDLFNVDPIVDMVVTKGMWDRLREIYPDVDENADYLTQVYDTFMVHLTNEERAKLDIKIFTFDLSGPHLRVLLDDYKGHIHLNRVMRHIRTMLSIYDNPMVKEYCEKYGLTRDVILVHDYSRASVIETTAYTFKMVHGACDFNDPRFQAGVECHHKRNWHHPQFFKEGEDMGEESLMESILDMASHHYEQILGSDPNVLLSNVFDIPPTFLNNYTNDDRKKVEHHLSVFRAMEGTVGGMDV